MPDQASTSQNSPVNDCAAGNIAIIAYFGTTDDARELPDLRPLAYRRVLDVGAGMDHDSNFHKTPFVNSSSLN